MSLVSRLMSRAGQAPMAAAPARPKAAVALQRMEEDDAQPMTRAPIARQEEEEAVQALARAPLPGIARQEEEEELPLARMEEEEAAQALRREPEEEEAQALRRQEEEEALPLSRMEEEEEAQTLRRAPGEEEEEELQMVARNATTAPAMRMGEEDAAQSLRRMEEEEAAHPLHRMEEEEEAQTIRREPEEQEEALPMHRTVLHRQPPPDADGLTAETSPAPPEIAMEDDTPPAMMLRREGVATVPGMAEATASDPAAGFAAEPPQPDWMPPEPIISNPDQGHYAAPPQDDPARVVIEQVDVIIEEPSSGSAPAPRTPSVDYAAMAKRRYLGGL